jgi:hypothetical protein
MFWKLNFEKSWFLGEVRLWFSPMLAPWFWMFDFFYMRMFDGAVLKVYFLSSYGSSLLCFSIQRHFDKNSTV